MRAPGLVRLRATTAQACGLYPCLAPGRQAGASACLGIGVLGSGPFVADPFDAYAAGTLSNPNVLVVGQPGAGKSAAVKTMVHRLVGWRRRGQARRWVAICDPKGEYSGLADALGLPVVAMRPGGGVRLNPLDPGPGAPELVASRRMVLLAALLSTVLRRDLNPLEDAAVGWAVDFLAADPTAELGDVARLLSEPPAIMAERAGRSPAELAREVEPLRLALGKLLDRDLRGMFDGRSTVRLDPDGPGLVVDLSAVHHDPAALALVMVAATAWVQARLAIRDGTQRLQVVDEAWALLATSASVRHLQASWKLCRDYGVANIAVVHRISDLRSQSDDGTALAKVAAGLLADTETRVLFRQAPDQVAETRTLLDLTDRQAALLPNLARGRALWRWGEHAEVVQHVVAPSEWKFADSDGALLGRNAVFCDDFGHSAKFEWERPS
ncbi:MAG: ATP-binding protein [Actinomycetota bacterium]